MRLLITLAIGLSVTACHSDRSRVIRPSPTVPSTTVPTTGSDFTDRPDLGSPKAIPFGERLEETVQPTDPTCFTNWDQSGRCRQFAVVAPMDGKLTATLTWSTGADMDIFIVPASGRAVWNQSSTPTIDVSAGQTYGIVVMSYAPPQKFSVDTNIQP